MCGKATGNDSLSLAGVQNNALGCGGAGGYLMLKGGDC